MRFVYTVLYFDMLSYDNFGIEEISTHVASMKASYIMLYLDMFAYEGFWH